MDFFNQLTVATDSERLELMNAPVIQQTMNGIVSIETYIAFLTEAYHHVKHTVPLLMSCGGRLPGRLSWMQAAVADYIAEELGHEEWILNDIKVSGGNAEAVRNGQPGLATELMVAYAYDTIQRINPASFFGMVYVLEGTSITLASRAAEITRTTLGLPKKAFSYLESHGSLDLEHMKFFEQIMNRIDDENDQQHIIHAAKSFFHLYGEIFRNLPLATDTQQQEVG